MFQICGNVSNMLFQLFVEINSLFSYCIKFLIDIVKQPSGCFISFSSKRRSKMSLRAISCIKCVGGYSHLIKFEKSKQSKQRYKCLKCKETRIESYKYSAYNKDTNRQIVVPTKEGSGIRCIVRAL
jgi:hypothetical protein